MVKEDKYKKNCKDIFKTKILEMYEYYIIETIIYRIDGIYGK